MSKALMVLVAMVVAVVARAYTQDPVVGPGRYGVSCFTKQYMHPTCITFDTRTGKQVGDSWEAHLAGTLN